MWKPMSNCQRADAVLTPRSTREHLMSMCNRTEIWRSPLSTLAGIWNCFGIAGALLGGAEKPGFDRRKTTLGYSHLTAPRPETPFKGTLCQRFLMRKPDSAL